MRPATLPRLARVGGAALAVAALAAACGGGTHPSAAASTASPAAGVQTETVAGLGSVLADAQGRTLYVLLSTAGHTVPCTGACTTVWPPALEPAGVP
ncbi:MAG: COG4315 family predicted lipoprotein, partial [Mycobacteriales bacterium]